MAGALAAVRWPRARELVLVLLDHLRNVFDERCDPVGAFVGTGVGRMLVAGPELDRLCLLLYADREVGLRFEGG